MRGGDVEQPISFPVRDVLSAAREQAFAIVSENGT